MQDIAKEIITSAAGGDIDAFERIYKVYSSYVNTIAFRIVGNREDAEEVTQDVFVRVYRSLARFEFKSSFKTWIYRIATNSAINVFPDAVGVHTSRFFLFSNPALIAFSWLGLNLSISGSKALYNLLGILSFTSSSFISTKN